MIKPLVALKIAEVSKDFLNNSTVTRVLDNISFELLRGEIVGIRGENGSGKTTLFNIIAGIEKQTSGEVTVFQNDSKEQMRITVVFQNYNSTLLPWLNIENNICISLKILGYPKIERSKKLVEVLEKLNFTNLPLKNYPHQLSGGQRQKVAIARALIQEPDILILDEPFSNLDNSTSFELQDLLQEIHAMNKISILIVSHNIDQVLYLCDRIFILGNRPSTITKEFAIPFTDVRNRDLILSKEFEKYRNKILEFEYETIR
jgi:NitT/TauT family transport system ATP-binding protein